MRALFLKYLPVPLALLLVFSCGDRDGRVIPRNKMSEIYADMFVADQWLIQNYKASRVADTAFVYEAVFRKYGYDSDDYRKSVAYYMEDPDRFARILRKTSSILDERIADGKAELREQKREESMKPEISVRFDFGRILIFDEGYPRQTVRDSLEYFTGKQEYFIMDLQPFVKPVEFGHETYFPQEEINGGEHEADSI